MLLPLVVYAVTFIQLTSSQSTYDVDNDVIRSCGSTRELLSHLFTGVSQLQTSNSQLISSVSRLKTDISQLQTDVAELKTTNQQGTERKGKSITWCIYTTNSLEALWYESHSSTCILPAVSS